MFLMSFLQCLGYYSSMKRKKLLLYSSNCHQCFFLTTHRSYLPFLTILEVICK